MIQIRNVCSYYQSEGPGLTQKGDNYSSGLELSKSLFCISVGIIQILIGFFCPLYFKEAARNAMGKIGLGIKSPSTSGQFFSF